MPVMNHVDTVSDDIIHPESNKILSPTHTNDTIQIGEEDHSFHIGEESPEPDSSFDDRYFPLILSHIGSFDSFNVLYSPHNEEIIGVGAQCTVYKGTERNNGLKVAIQETVLNSKSALVCWFAKYLMIKQCSFYTKYEAYIIDPKTAPFTVLLVQELLDENLTQILTNNSHKMDEEEIKTMINDIVKQLDILQRNHNYIHLDIKPTNIMRRENGSYTLIDFGFAMECATTYNGYLGTKEWSAPEMKADEKIKNTIHSSTDMWSIALVIIYMLYNGHHPFCCRRKNKVLKKQSLENIRKWYQKKMKNKQCYIESWLGKKLITNQISYNLFDFLFKCLRFDPHKRLTPTEALNHKWLQCD